MSDAVQVRSMALVTAMIGLVRVHGDDEAAAEIASTYLDQVGAIVEELAVEAEEDTDRFFDAISDLASFAAKAVECWSDAVGVDALRLLQAIAQQEAR